MYNKNITMTAHFVCKGRVNMNIVRIGSKKALALFLILVFVFCASAPSFAANGFEGFVNGGEEIYTALL